MDELKLAALRGELVADCHVAEQTLQTAEARLAERTDSGLEAGSHYLARLYNIIEQMGVRIAKIFENQLAEESGWHAELVRRLSIPIQGVRPAFFSEECLQPLRELRGFRHVFTHAYDLRLDPDKIALLLKYARQVVPTLRPSCQRFIRQVAEQEGLAGFE